jgi:hypothetical protein
MQRINFIKMLTISRDCDRIHCNSGVRWELHFYTLK